MKEFIKKASRPDEIKSVLLEALGRERVFTVWQRKGDNTLAFNVKARLESIDDKGNYRFVCQGETPEIQMGDVFFAIEDSSVLFKTPQVELKGAKLIVPAPQEASYRERRRHKRKYFKFSDHKDVELIFKELIDPESGEPLPVKSKVLDVSASGACFLVSKETLGRINPDEFMTLKSLSDVVLGSTKAKIMNARRYKGRKLNQEELYAIGVMFC